MSDTNIAATPQPAPTGTGTVVLDSILGVIDQHIDVTKKLPKQSVPQYYTVDGLVQLKADLKARAEMGKAKYGTYLRANNGRNPIVDLYQEILDAIMYAQQGCLEEDDEVSSYVVLLLNVAQRLALVIKQRNLTV